MNNLSERHPNVRQIMRYFDYSHLPDGPWRERAQDCHAWAHWMVGRLPDGPELTAGLRKLLEAKDCFVRAALDVRDDS